MRLDKYRAETEIVVCPVRKRAPGEVLPDIFDVASDLVINRDTADDFLVIIKQGIAVTS
jgi:hypothetical protein